VIKKFMDAIALALFIPGGKTRCLLGDWLDLHGCKVQTVNCSHIVTMPDGTLVGLDEAVLACMQADLSRSGVKR
jgi:hypothetical protein